MPDFLRLTVLISKSNKIKNSDDITDFFLKMEYDTDHYTAPETVANGAIRHFRQ